MGIVERLRRAAGGLIADGAGPGTEPAVVVGLQTAGSLAEGSVREWLVTDGCGGYAMGTVAGLRTRRYHGLQVHAQGQPGVRRLGLAALDAVVVLGDRRIELSTHEWAPGHIEPRGHRLLEAFAVVAGVPRWRWRIGGVVVEREVAMPRGVPVVAVVHRVVAAPHPVRLELVARCADRDQHDAQRAVADGLLQAPADGGCTIGGWYRLRGPGFVPTGRWGPAEHLREEAARGEQPADEHLWEAGTFEVELGAGESAAVVAWAGDLSAPPPPGEDIVRAARSRWRTTTASALDGTDALLLAAADQFVVDGPTGPAVVAGYPWFGEWGRDTFVAFEGLLVTTGRAATARSVLRRAAQSLSEGMLASTTDSGRPAFHSVDAALWFVHALGVYVESTGDTDLAAELAPALDSLVEHHIAGTRHGISIDDDGLLVQGAPGLALTWMDARTGDEVFTPRQGTPVEVQALWVNALGWVRVLNERIRRDPDRFGLLEHYGRLALEARFPTPAGHLADVVGGPGGGDTRLRPNQLLAGSLPHAPGLPTAAVAACRDALLTPLGMRTLAPGEPGYAGSHRGDRRTRDAAYHNGTVWPWLLGSYLDAAVRAGIAVTGTLDGVEAHLGDWGLGSVSETADAEPPFVATGCPFQAWSVAEVLRARRRHGERLRSGSSET